jgi:hypothetical protein
MTAFFIVTEVKNLTSNMKQADRRLLGCDAEYLLCIYLCMVHLQTLSVAQDTQGSMAGWLMNDVVEMCGS